VIDIVFSLDSVITAVGMVDQIGVMVAAVVTSVAVMLVAAKPIGEFVDRHPSVKVLALAFLVMVGMALTAEAFDDARAQGLHLRRHGLLAGGGGAQHPRPRQAPGFEDEQARVIAGTVNDPVVGSVRVIGCYFPNGQAPDSDKFVYKMNWLNALQAWVQDELTRHPNLVIMGDYNIAPTDADVYDPVGWKDQIHCTVPEREHFQKLLQLGLTDAFRLFEQPPKPWSWWDYRNLAFRKNQGLRIDHILVSDALKPRVSACVIDKAPRKNERPSDHAPVIVTLG
jgi:exodeoxyribonuclease III